MQADNFSPATEAICIEFTNSDDDKVNSNRCGHGWRPRVRDNALVVVVGGYVGGIDDENEDNDDDGDGLKKK